MVMVGLGVPFSHQECIKDGVFIPSKNIMWARGWDVSGVNASSCKKVHSCPCH